MSVFIELDSINFKWYGSDVRVSRRDLQFNKESEPWCGTWYSPYSQSMFAVDIITYWYFCGDGLLVTNIPLFFSILRKCSCCICVHSFPTLFCICPLTWSLYLVLGLSIMHLFITFSSTAVTGIVLSFLCNMSFNLTNFLLFIFLDLA
jgi:hypothetical protein